MSGKLGILVLNRILFGGFHPGWHMYWRRRMMERWEQVTPEEREKFRQGMRGRCGLFGAPAAALVSTNMEFPVGRRSGITLWDRIDCVRSRKVLPVREGGEERLPRFRLPIQEAAE
jgi:hypothetical protein